MIKNKDNLSHPIKTSVCDKNKQANISYSRCRAVLCSASYQLKLQPAVSLTSYVKIYYCAYIGVSAAGRPVYRRLLSCLVCMAWYYHRDIYLSFCGCDSWSLSQWQQQLILTNLLSPLLRYHGESVGLSTCVYYTDIATGNTRFRRLSFIDCLCCVIWN